MRAERGRCGYAATSAHHSHPWLRHSLMRLTIALLGHTFDVSLEPTATEASDEGAALNGGLLATDRVPVELGPSELFMGFTNGREGCDDPEDGRQP